MEDLAFYERKKMKKEEIRKIPGHCFNFCLLNGPNVFVDLSHLYDCHNDVLCYPSPLLWFSVFIIELTVFL